jgi:malate dehydrogenase
MDTMTQMVVNYMYDNFGQPKNSGKVFGMGGILDSARFKYNILMAVKNKYHLPPSINNAFVIGGHGDTTMIPLVDYVTVDGYSLDHFFSEDEINEIVEKTMKGGATLTKMLCTSAWEAPAQGICEMIKMIAFDENVETVASVYHEGNGIDLCIGSRVKIGNDGVSEMIDENYICSDYIREKYNASVEAIRNVNKAL